MLLQINGAYNLLQGLAQITENKSGTLTVFRDSADKKIYKESTLYYHIEKALQKEGISVICTDMSKECMTGNKYYLRTPKRQWKKGMHIIAIYDSEYCIRDLSEEYRKFGFVNLVVELIRIEGANNE